MTFKKFVARTAAALADYFGPNYQVEVREVTKNNGIIQTGVTVCRNGASIGATIYLEEPYQHYNRGLTFEELLHQLIRIYEANPPADFMSGEFIANYRNIKEHLSCRLINAARNEDKLQEMPCKRMMDLALIYCVNFRVPTGTTSMVVTNSLMEMWAVSEEQLFRDAVRDLPERMPAKLCWIDGEMEEHFWQDRSCEEVLYDGGDPNRLLIVTNREQSHGAVQMVNVPLLKLLSKRLEGNYYILPSSVHEILVIKDSEEVDMFELRRMLQEVNHSMLDPEEYLSDHLYYYDANEDTILVR